METEEECDNCGASGMLLLDCEECGTEVCSHCCDTHIQSGDCEQAEPAEDE